MKNALCTYKKHREQKSYAGVTLLEILIAVGILALSISAIMQVFPMGFSSSARASYTAIAYELANMKMEEIRSTYIFGGDPDPKLDCNNKDTYKFFGYRYDHPLSVIYGEQYDFRKIGDVKKFHEFRSSDGANVESRYFYRVEMIPQVDACQKSGNYIYASAKTSGSDGDNEIGSLNDSNRFIEHGWCYGFCDTYRVKVTVRGPVRKLDHAQDENWKYYKKAAVEANLATIITNKELGLAYLALDQVCRIIDDSNTERMMSDWYRLDSRSIYVTGPGGKRFYPETFTVLRPEHLTMNERWDTGPAITFPINQTKQSKNIDAYYASRRGGNRHAYSYYRSYGNSGPINPSEQVSSHYIDFDNSVRKSKSQQLEFTNSIYSNRAHNSSWNDLSWDTTHDPAKQIKVVNPKTDLGTGTNDCAHSGDNFVPGGLNLLGQDNIMLICKDPEGHFYAESNKLIFMVPPKSKCYVVNQTGTAHWTYNSSDYWRFDLLNNVYGRDSDCKVRSKYGTANRPLAPLVDNEWGNPDRSNRTTTNARDWKYDYQGDFDLKDYNDKVHHNTRTITIGTSYLYSQNHSPELVTVDGENTGTSTINLTNTRIKRYIGYPKAHFDSAGNFEGGTVVRFLMQMPTRE